MEISPEEFEKIWAEAKEQIKQENAKIPIEDLEAWIQNNRSLEYTSYLEKKTLESIAEEKWEVLSKLSFENINKTFQSLRDYRYVDEINELQKGKYIRWIRSKPVSAAATQNSFSLTNGGIVMDIKFLDTGIHILCKTNQNRILQYRFDECPTFQKISPEEYMILLSNSHLA
jgi:hypothetical protein